MEHWEKEEHFAETFANGRTAKNLWKYIPNRLLEAIEDCYTDCDGYWVCLADGYVAYDGGGDCRQIHEYNVTDLRMAIKTIRKV